MGYPRDLADKELKLIEYHFDCGNYGNRSVHKNRNLVNAVFYYTKSGCQWRMLPKDFSPYSTVNTFYRRCRIKGIWEKVMDDLEEKNRIEMGRNATPSYCLIDSQSVKTTSASEERGIDGRKK